MIGRSDPAYWDDFEFSESDYSPDFVFRDKDSKVGPLVWTLVWQKTRYGDQVEEKEVEDFLRRKWPWKLGEQKEGEDKNHSESYFVDIHLLEVRSNFFSNHMTKTATLTVGQESI